MTAARPLSPAQELPTTSQVAGWRAFLTAHARVIAVLERELLVERGMPVAWYDVLVVLSESPENRLRMHDVASAVILSRAGLTRLIDRMAGAALVERVPCEDDRRGTFVNMTAAGRAALDAASPVHLRGIREHFTQYLSDDELGLLERALGRVVAAIPGASAKASGPPPSMPRPGAPGRR
ncbi:MAG: MarR family winged helix-turn-helix transcriptional regulator [Dehalococcoidia bacterium]